MDPSGARREEKHNRLMNERLLRGLSGANAPPPPPPPPPPSSDEPHGILSSSPSGPPSSSSDVTASMVKRLQQLEKDAKAKSATIQQLRLENDGLQRRVQELEREREGAAAQLRASTSSAPSPSDRSESDMLRKEVERLRGQLKLSWRQVGDMKRFLNDYGMVWVGDESPDAPPPPDAPPAPTPRPPPLPPGGRAASPGPQGAQGPSRPGWTGLDIKALQRRISDLNASLDPPSSAAPPLPLVVYRDGLQLGAAPFRQAGDPAAQGILVDVLDGYFPFLLQDTYPEGVPLVLLDMTSMDYQRGVPPLPTHRGRGGQGGEGRGNVVGFGDLEKGAGAPVSKDRYLRQLPQTVIREGRVIEVRSEIKAMLEGGGGGAGGGHVKGLTPSQAAAEAARAREAEGGRSSDRGVGGGGEDPARPSSSSGAPPSPPQPRLARVSSGRDRLAPLRPRHAAAAAEISMMDTPAIDQLLAGRRSKRDLGGIGAAAPQGGSGAQVGARLDWLAAAANDPRTAAAPAAPPPPRAEPGAGPSMSGPVPLRPSTAEGSRGAAPGGTRPGTSGGGDASSAPPPPPEAPGTTLQIKSFDGQQVFIVKMLASDTVGALRRRVQALVLVQGFELRTAFPPVAYSDDRATLQEAGLVPSATLILRKTQ